MKFLVTGGNGFIGRAFIATLTQCNFEAVLAVRRKNNALSQFKQVIVGEIDRQTDWENALAGVDVVIHLAARVHIMHDATSNPLNEFRRINTYGTEHLARMAAASGVKRFVYVSSIKVNGEETRPGQRYSEHDKPAPQDAYAVSKWEAEQSLHRIADETGLEIVIVRPPLVYGGDVKGNFEQMMRVIMHGVPLPLTLLRNQRDLIYVGNLVGALMACATHPAATRQTFLVCDGKSVSTPELIQNLAKALDRPCLIFPFPVFILKFFAGFFGQSATLDRLSQSLIVDDSKIRTALGWQPAYTFEQGIKNTAESYLVNCSK